MLQRIRDGLHGRKWLAWLALAPIALIFVFWGGSNSLDFGGAAGREAATVNGEKISADEAKEAWSQTQARWSQQFGTDIPPDQRTRMQENILDNLVLRKLVELRLKDQNYRVSEAAVLAEFQEIPQFKDENGKFDPNLARMVLRQFNKTEREFFNETRQQLLVNQLQQGIGGSYFLTRGEAQRLANLENEEREVQYVELAADKFAGTEPVDEAAVKSYYDKNGDRFMTTESVSLDFAELRLEQLAAQVQPTEEALRKVYDENRANYVLEERRRTRHIVIPVSEDDAAALKKAESVLAEARSGKDFAELAKKYSSDITARDGGDLGFVEKKQFAGPIGDALFGLKVGEVAGPIKSQFGYHIIKLEEIQAAEAKPFEAVRAELEAQYRQDQSATLFGQRQDEIMSALEKGTTDLDKLAQDLGLARGSIPEFLRGGGAEPLGSSPELQQAVFSDAALNQGKIAGPVALGEDRLVLVKITGHRKAEVKPLAAVHDEIVALLRHERGVTAAKKAADEAVARLTGGEKLETLAAGWGLAAEPARFVSRGDPSLPGALRTALFEAPRPTDKPVVRTATLDDGSAALFVVSRTRVSDTGANPQIAQQQNSSLLQRAATGDVSAYVNEAKRQAEIVKNPAVFE